MKREFEHEDFEDFLKRNADGFRMKAPDAVWKKISKDLNKRRRRTVWGVGLAILITSVAGYFASTSAPDASPASASKNNPSSKTNPSASLAPVVRMSERANTSASPFLQSTTSNDKPIAANPAPVVPIGRAIRGNRSLRNTTSGTATITGKPTQSPTNAASLQSSPALDETVFVPTVVDSYPETEEGLQQNAQKTLPAVESETPTMPFTIESVLNTYGRKTKAKVEIQLYFTPTISYRKLSENKSYLQKLDPSAIAANYAALTSTVSSNVTHKPDLGFELGLAVKYPLTEKLKLRTGIQFNVNRYDVKAFSSNWTMATIALNSGSRADSLRSLSTYSNEAGYQSNWLQNFSFQISAPVGIEYNFGGNDKLQLGMAYTVQPTYVLNDRSYIITTDYKRYTQVPWLLRRWNLNTAFETFVTYKPGKTRWQLGPQVRYQLLSSFISEYPVKENLFDFGLKLGVSLGK